MILVADDIDIILGLLAIVVIILLLLLFLVTGRRHIDSLE